MNVVKMDFPDKDLYILADGDWRGFRSKACAKEPETVEWIRSFEPNSVFWDVGASVGSYSLIAAALGHTVHAFEPFLPSAGHLQQNVWLNKFGDTIHVWPVALTNLSMNLGFGPIIPTYESHWGTFMANSQEAGAASHGRGKFRQHVMKEEAGAIGDFIELRPAHVKIDVDGAELGVIEGGRETWKHVKSIMVESEPPTIDDITVILNSAGLTLVDSWKRLGDTKQRNYLYRRTQ